MLSVGPPLSHARTGKEETIPSTGIIPKCSLVGVYRSACVVGDVSSQVRCSCVKLRRNTTSADVAGVTFLESVLESGGVMWYVRACA